MSLLRLLSAGKSLVGMRDMDTRYRVTSQRLLPRFGPARNPFSSRAKAEPAQAEGCPPENHNENNTPVTRPTLPGLSREPAAVLHREAECRPGPARLGPRNLARALWLRMAGFLRDRQAKLCGLLTPSAGKVSKPAIPRFPKPPVQGELSLDRIKVVRNDLSDADLEVVPAKPLAAPAANAPALRAVEQPEGAESGWGRVATRILGAGKT